MLAPYRWIQDYVKIDDTAEALAEKMIMTGNGVENIIHLGDDLTGVVVGRILKLEKHPDADRLQICQIDIGKDEPVQIVTGATNVFEGAYVPAALVGAKLPNGLNIKKGKLRGVPSLGMLCSGEELCIGEEDFPGAGVDGIFILQGEPKPGQDIREFLGLQGSVLEFEIGANRPDCLSMLGIAKEAAAAVQKPFVLPDVSFEPGSHKISELVSVDVQAQDLCPRYMAAGVLNVKIGPSPEWMKKRLREAGLRSINNIVDITNFVMLETGQPMHAFDASDIRGGKIVVRRAQEGETLVTLDGKERVLTPSMLMICDAQGPIGLAGVMGGENSEIKQTTTQVVFESANFMYGNIRQTSRALGLATESSMRYSKGVAPVTAELALKRALHLVCALQAGEVTQDSIDLCAVDLCEKHIDFPAKKVNDLLGTDIPAQEMVDYLQRVQIKTTLCDGILHCVVPQERGDIYGSADIAEEVARIYGYDRIDASVMTGEIAQGTISPLESAKDILRNYLCCTGFHECVTYSFAGEQDSKKLLIDMPDSIRIRNPLGDDTAYMRTNMLSDLLKCISNNLAKKNLQLRLFETGKIYIPKALPVTETPDEYPVLAMACVGENEDFYTLKGVVENIVMLLCGKSISCKRLQAPYFHPGRSAELSVDGNCIGEMGEIHMDVQENYDIGKPVYAAQIYLDRLLVCKKEIHQFTSLPKFPASERDIAVIVDESTGAGDVLETILASGTKKLEHAELFDVYRSEQLGADKKSLAYKLVFRADDRTLTDEETDGAVKKILTALEKEYQAKLR